MFGFGYGGSGDGVCPVCEDSFIKGLSERDKMLVTLAPMIMHIGELTRRIGDTKIFDRFDLNTLRYAILRHLDAIGKPVSMKVLSESMVKSPAGITQNIDFLEKRGFVNRVPSQEDRRVNLIEMTPEGSEILEQANKFYIEKVRELMKDLPDDKLQIMYNMLHLYMVKTIQILELPFDFKEFLMAHGISEK